MAPLLNPSPVLGLRSPCSFFNQDIYFLRDIWQCLGTFLVVTTRECTNIQWVKDSDPAKCPTVHMTVPTTKNVNECWRCKSLPGPPSLSGKRCSQWASPYLLQVSAQTQPGTVAYPDLLDSQVTLMLSIHLCIVIPIYSKAKHRGLGSLLLIYL